MRLFTFLVIALCAFDAACADIVAISVNGRLIASPCRVNSSQSNFLVQLGNTPAATLANKYSATPEVYFKIVLDQCPESTNSVIASFSGQTYPQDANYGYANNGTSQFVGVLLKLTDEPDHFVSNTRSGKSVNLKVDKSTNSVVFNFSTRLWTDTGNVTPGTINSAVTISFTYQ